MNAFFKDAVNNKENVHCNSWKETKYVEDEAVHDICLCNSN